MSAPESTDTKEEIEYDDDEEDLEPCLRNILEQESLKWIFVGGKGGVGKTTTSCSLAVMLAQQREKVLIISTDPAHNLSDAFGQEFGSTETQVQGIPNLYAMEVDPKVDLSNVSDELIESTTMSMLTELSTSIPGIDEAMSFAELVKQIKKKDFDVIIFDTAPTGHTLRFLSFPQLLEKGLGKLESLQSQFGGLFSNLTSMLANQGNGAPGLSLPNQQEMAAKLQDLRETVATIREQFEDPEQTTFVCVCIAEFLSLYETERLVQKLAEFGIDAHNIVINQVLYPEKDGNCSRCRARVKMQSRYIEQFFDLYPDFHLTKMPLLDEEVRHLNKLRLFAHLLLNPYNPEDPLPQFEEADDHPGAEEENAAVGEMLDVD